MSDENHWYSFHTNDVSLLIDAKAYYKEFFAACRKAKASIDLAGWVMEDRLLLSKHDSQLPDSLVEFFKSLAFKKSSIKINTMVWTPGRYLDFGRQSYSESRWSDKLPANLTHQRDKSRYLFGSHHEKYALIDNHTLFIGGMDITSGRYDDRDHKAQYQHRRLPGGKRYKPRHDVQLKINANFDRDSMRLPSLRSEYAEQNLTTLARSNKAARLYDANLYLSRTAPGSSAFEIEALYLKAIKCASDWIYIENQYFTNARIARAIERRLLEDDPPEIVLVSSMRYGGVFERAIFEKKRNHFIDKLKAADHKNRFRAYYPSIPEESKDSFVVVHSKLMAIDERFLTVGSANLNERSMRVDTELNASIEAKGPTDPMGPFIQQCVCDLLAEHLGATPSLMQKDLNSFGLINAIERNQKNQGRSLRPIVDGEFSWWERLAYLIANFVDIKKGLPKHA